MKSSVFPFIAGSMTVLGVWFAYENRKALDKLVKSIGDTTEQTIEKFKAKMDETKVDTHECCHNHPE